MKSEVKIKLFGAGCSRCIEAENIIREFFNTNQQKIDLEKISDVKEMVKLGIVVTPAIEINGELIFHGRIPKKFELETWLSTYKNSIESE